MSKQQQMHFKETTPEKTVEKLKGILKELDIPIVEQWQEASCVDTYSLRIEIENTDVGTNGKGMTKEYALASAYAEFFERFQNGLLCNSMSLNADLKHKFEIAPDEKILMSEEIVKENNPLTEFYFKDRGMQDASVDEKAKAFNEVNRVEYMLNNREDGYLCLPFYNVKTKKINYLPKMLYQKYYGSNGMSAGNTPEEAIVQGLSEIFERVVQKRVFKEKTCFPDVPESYIKKFPDIYDMYKKLKSLEGYEVMMKDCSYGGKYPVAALVMLQKNTGRYGLKMGCHPDFGVAMERTFTEAAQGNDILEYVNRSIIDFENNGVDEEDNIVNSFKIGLAQYPYQIFGKKFDYKFTEVKNVENMTNKEIMSGWIQEILNDGYDILIRDVSNFDFPSYHIIIPGLSELRTVTDEELRADNTRTFISGFIANPSKITIDKCPYILGCLGYYSRRIMESSIATYLPKCDVTDYPYENIGLGNLYFGAMCHVMMGDYIGASKKITLLLQASEKRGLQGEDYDFLKATKFYLSAMAEIKDEKEVKKYMELIFTNEMISKIYNVFGNRGEVFKKQYTDLDKTTDRMKAQDIVDHVFYVLKEGRANNPIEQMCLSGLF